MRARVLPLLILLALALILAFPLSSAARVETHPGSTHPLTGNITGPNLLPVAGKGTYVITASGGPAELSNGTVTGNYTYSTSLIGVNTTGGIATPSTGTLKNGTAQISLSAPNNTGSYTLTVNVSSNPRSGNSTHIVLSYSFTVAAPYVISVSLANHNDFTVTGAEIAVILDGSTITTITLPSIAANGTYAFTYNYTTTGLSPGSHTFTLEIQGTYGLLTFSGGGTQLSVSVYVTPPATDYTLYYATGIALVGLAIFISLFVVGGNRRRRNK
jgi:hypothetical protein